MAYPTVDECCAQVVTHKRGNTFEVQATYADDATGESIDLTGYTIASQVRSPGGDLVSTMAVTIPDQTIPANRGKFSMRVSDTTAWPIGELLWDVQYSFDETVISTETITIQVAQDITQS